MQPAQKGGVTNNITEQITQLDQSSVSGSGPMVQKDAQLGQDVGIGPASHTGIQAPIILLETRLCSQGGGPSTKLQLGGEGLDTSSITGLCH